MACPFTCSCPAGYSAAVVFVVIVLLLYHVQQDIENPFDMDGLDDVFFDVGNEVMDDVMLNTFTTNTGVKACTATWVQALRYLQVISHLHATCCSPLRNAIISGYGTT